MPETQVVLKLTRLYYLQQLLPYISQDMKKNRNQHQASIHNLSHYSDGRQIKQPVSAITMYTCPYKIFFLCTSFALHKWSNIYPSGGLSHSGQRDQHACFIDRSKQKRKPQRISFHQPHHQRCQHVASNIGLRTQMAIYLTVIFFCWGHFASLEC
jgi:hypothetical protein